MVYNCGKRLMSAFLLLVCTQVAAFGQQSLLGLRLQQTAGGGVLTLQGPAGGFSADYTLRMPAALGGTGSLLYMTATASQLNWLAAGTNGYILSLSGGLPVWVDPATIGVAGWGLSGNSIINTHFLGTTNANDLVIKTDNAYRMSIVGGATNTGNVAIGTTTATTSTAAADIGDRLTILGGDLSLNSENNFAITRSILFRGTSGVGNFRIGADGGDLFWQGGGGQNLQMGSYWRIDLLGQRQVGGFPSLSSSATDCHIYVPLQQASIPGIFLRGAASQTGDLMQWQTSTGSVLSSVSSAGEMYSNFFRVNSTTGKPAYAEGRVFYDSTEKALSYYNDHSGITLNIGQENWIHVRNVTGSSIANGQAVYINGSDASVKLPTIALARADALATADAIGIVTETIANGASGYVTSFGVVHQLNTSAFAAGAILYVSPTTAGAVTTTRPSQPNFTNPIGFVETSNATTGSILVISGKTRQGASTTGAVAFGGSDGFLKENATNFVWDNTNTRLGIGLNAPAQKLDIRDGNLLLSRSAVSSRQLQFQSANGAGLSTFEAGSQGATNFNYTLPITAPTTNQVLTATAVAGSAITFGWSSNATSSEFVSYGPTAAQATATPRTDYLFNVEYASGAGNAAAAGAQITSSAGASGSGNNATGLTVNSTVNNGATATGVVVSSTAGGTNSSTTGMTITSTASGSGTARGLTTTVSGGTTNYAATFMGGNVGIDTATPGSKLSVNGETYSNHFRVNSTTGKPAYAEGRVFYDSAEKALSYYNDHSGITLNIGQENWIHVRNVTGSSIANGQAVYINGSDASVKLPTIALARADALATSDAIGIVTETIANGASGYVTSFGVVHQLNTSAFAAGAILYVSPTTAGAVTTTRPSQPNFTNPIGFVETSNATTGSILVISGKTRQGASTTGAVAFGGSDGFLKENATNFLWDNTNSRLTLISPSTTDEHYSLRAEASGTSTNQIIGVWGDASNTGTSNTGTIGILATGNGNTTASQTNTALQINDGSLNIGRTTEAPGTGTAVEAATGGTAYTAQGPSGVIELAPFNADQVLAAAGNLSWADHITINNRYATANSIILLQVLNTADGTTNQVAGAFNTADVTFSTLVDNRQTGTFEISINMYSSAALTVDGGAGATDKDLIRIGYTVINPSK